MRLRLTHLLAFIASLFCTCIPTLFAQDYLYATGSPQFSSTLPIDHGFVNVNNGEIHLDIPLATKPQRGDLALNEHLTYDSRVWKFIASGGNYQWTPTNVPNSNGGWLFSSGLGTGAITFSENAGNYPNSCAAGGPPPQTYLQYYNWVWTDPGGTRHSFPWADTIRVSSPPTGTGNCDTLRPAKPSSASGASDGSGYTLNLTNYTIPTITDIHGITYYPYACLSTCTTTTPLLSDRNGNFWSQDSSGNLIDTSGVVPVQTTTSGNTTTYSVLGANGARQPYVVTLGVVYYNTSFAESAVTEASGSFNAIQSIVLPDKTSYTFTYDSGTTVGHYGELTGMTLPNGGTVSFAYQVFTDSFKNANEWISTITRDGGITAFNKTVTSYCSSSQGCQEQTSVVTPDGASAQYIFTLDKTGLVAGSSWVSSLIRFVSASSAAALMTENTSYTYSSEPQFILQNGVDTAVGTSESPTGYTNTTTLPDVRAVKQTATTLWLSSPVPSTVTTTDFSTSGNPPILTKTTYTYGNPPSLYLPSNVAVTDSSGNQISSTTYGYDETSLVASSSSTPNHTATTGGKNGNRTSQTDWINSPSGTLKTTWTYDDAGVMQTSSPPDGTTTYGYDTTDTFRTSTASPNTPSGVAIKSTAAFDGSTGIVTAQYDANKQPTTFKNFDVFNRPQEVDAADGGISKVAYTANLVTTTFPLGSQTSGTLAENYDTYGRRDRDALSTGQGSTYYQHDSCFDTTGRLAFVSTRYQGSGLSASKICSGTGDTYSYDPIGRIQTITHSDGSKISYAYRGRATQITDENGVSRISQVDGLGRLTLVCEISSASLSGGGAPTSCGADITGQNGYLTTYTYDLANHKVTVQQGSQSRVFQTDSLGRSIYTSEPERGITKYNYAYNSTGLLVTRFRPTANIPTSSTTPTTTTASSQYDSVGRLVNVRYSDATPQRLFEYDRNSANWSGSQNNLVGRMSDYILEDGSGNTITENIFSYDQLGRIAFNGQCLPASCSNHAYDKYVAYTYDYQGDMLSVGATSGPTITYGYTPALQLSSITGPGYGAQFPANLLSTVVNGPFGPLSYSLGDGLTGTRGYDTRGRETSVALCSGSTAANCSGGSTIYSNSLTYTGARITQNCDTVLGSCLKIGYDDFDRVVSNTSVSGAALTESWIYDQYGNRWSQSSSQGGYNTSTSYAASNNHAVNSSYDIAGNLLNDGVHSYTYDAEGKIIQVDGGSTATYLYDAGDKRVRAVVGSTPSEFLFDQSSDVLSVWYGVAGGGSYVQNTYWDGRQLSYSDSNGVHFFQQDWLGTERMTRSYSGALEAAFSSLPYGDSSEAAGTTNEPFSFAELSRNPETGLDLATERSYSSPQGRWMSPDPYDGSYDFANPQTFNRYAYVGNNPIGGIDASGMNGEVPGVGGPGFGGCIGAAEEVGANYILDAECGLDLLLDFWPHKPQFHGTLRARPSGGIWDEHSGITYGPNIAGALGLPDKTCEFGACDIGAISSFASGVSSLASAGSCLSSSFGLPGAGSGAITIASLPTLSTGVKIGESPTVGTSILSTTLRTLLPQRNFGSIWAPTIGNIGSRTPVLGGAVSRWAGWVGVAVTTYQTAKFVNCLKGSGGGSPGIGGGGASGGAGASGDWFH